jgi:hypothetical protein
VADDTRSVQSRSVDPQWRVAAAVSVLAARLLGCPAVSER